MAEFEGMVFEVAAGRRFCEVRASSDDPAIAEIEIYDEIGFWGTTAARFASFIKAITADELRVYLNSPGGDAFDGLAIMNALRRHPAKVVVTVDSLAASAASVIAMAGDEIVMNRGAEFMIHEVSSGTWGDAAEMRKIAEALEKISDSYADAYAARAGGSRAAWRERMLAETWFTAEEAVDAGLATSWVDAKPVKAVASARASFDLSKFRYRGRAAAPAPVLGAMDGSAPSRSAMTSEEDAVTYEELREALAERLEVDPAEVTDEELLDALDEALASEESEDDDPEGDPEGDPGDGGEGGEASAATIGTAHVDVVPVLPAGMEVIDSATLAELRSAAERGRVAEASAAEARRVSAFEDAVRTGRVAPASRALWLEHLERDERGAAALLASLTPNTVPVSEIGTSDADASAEDALYNRAFGTTDEEASDG